MKHFLKSIVIFSFALLVSCGEKKDKTPVATYTVTAKTNRDYRIDGGSFKDAKNPTLTLKRGATYAFIVKAFGHPFYIKTEKIRGVDKTYDTGVTENGIDEGTILFTVAKDAPDTLYYVCKYHSMMAGELKIVD